MKMTVISKKSKGIIYSIVSASLYGLCAVLTKLTTQSTLTVTTLIFCRGICGMVMLFILATIKRQKIQLKKGHVRKVLFYGFFGTATTQYFLNRAYFHTSVGTATTIHFLFPAVVSLVSALIFKEKISKATVITLVISTLAMTMFIDSFSGSMLMGIIFSLLSVCTWSFQLIYMEQSGVVTDDKTSMTFFVCLAMVLFGGSIGLATRTLSFVDIRSSIFQILIITLLNNICATILSQKGVEAIGASLMSVFCVFEPITSIIFGFLILRELPLLRQVIACVIIISSITFMIISNNKIQREEK